MATEQATQHISVQEQKELLMLSLMYSVIEEQGNLLGDYYNLLELTRDTPEWNTARKILQEKAEGHFMKMIAMSAAIKNGSIYAGIEEGVSNGYC